MDTERKTVFISYSWDNEEHQEWVLKLATDLIEKFGIDVILDQFELSAGKDLTYFMENSIERADKVLVILTPNYKKKAENRERGVGYECSMISQEIFESPISKVKFIPILRIGNTSESFPKFLKTKIYLQMDNEERYYSKLYELSKIIYDKPLITKPKLGEIPDFDKDIIDPIIDMGIELSNEEKLNNELDMLLSSSEGVRLFENETLKLNNTLKEKAEIYKNHSRISFYYTTNHRDKSIISVAGYSVTFYWSLSYSNTTRDAKLIVRYFKGAVGLEYGVYFPGDEPKVVKDEKYSFDLNYDKEVIWKSEKSDKSKQTTNELIQSSFLYLIESLKEEKTKNFRKK